MTKDYRETAERLAKEAYPATQRTFVRFNGETVTKMTAPLEKREGYAKAKEEDLPLHSESLRLLQETILRLQRARQRDPSPNADYASPHEMEVFAQIEKLKKTLEP